MTKSSIKLQILRRKIYIKAKAEPSHRFWGLYVLVCKSETIENVYKLVKANGGLAGIDQVTFGQINLSGTIKFLQEIEASLKDGSYIPMKNRIVWSIRTRPLEMFLTRLPLRLLSLQPGNSLTMLSWLYLQASDASFLQGPWALLFKDR